jgi:Ca2+-binding RTX toxin-like protein
MTVRTRRVAIDGGGTGNDWSQSGSFVSFNSDGYFSTFLNFEMHLGGNGTVVNAVTLWSAGILSLGLATQEQIDFMASGQSPIPSAGNAGFPGEFFLVDYDEGAEHSSYSYGIGGVDYSAPFDSSIPGAFFSFDDSFQIILDESGFSIVRESASDEQGLTGYYIGGLAEQTSGSEIEFLNYPDFFTYTGTADADQMIGSQFLDRFLSSPGADVIDGNDVDYGNFTHDPDLVSYANSPSGVTVNLATGTGSGGYAEGDTYIDIEQVIGSPFADTIIGDAGNDNVIEGGAGADNLDGGAGFDWVSYAGSPSAVSVSLATGLASGGDAAGDTIANFEMLRGSAWNDTLEGSAINNQLDGGAGDDVLTGLAGNDTLFGGDGNDFLVGGAGADSLYGGNGIDTASYADSPAAVTINLLTNVFSGGDAAGDFIDFTVENVVGSVFADSITGDNLDNRLTGGGGSDTLSGGAGNDVLDGGTGSDTMAGGTEDDAYFVDNPGDVVTENAGEGTDTVLTQVNYSLSANVERGVIFDSAGTISLYGNALDNELTGDGNGNILNGGAGVDLMVGNGGDDYYVVDNPGDQAIEIPGGGYDTVFASANFTLNHDLERVVAFDLRSTNAINFTGNELANELVGNDGANVIDGAAGADVMTGNAGNDVYFVDNAGDLVNELAGGGYDTVFTSVNYTLRANVERGVISGAVGTISLYGNELANELSGDDAGNIFNGGAGADVMTGYGGDDYYVVDNPGDQIVELAGGGYDTVFASANFTLNHDLERVVAFDLRSTNAMNFTGNELANELVGNDGANVIDGGAGADVMTGYGGNDVYFVDNAGDLVNESAGGGYDTVFTSINYLLGSSTGGQIERLAVADRAAAQGLSLRGNGLDNEISGDDGNNIIDGEAGRDILTGYAGSDSFVFSSALGSANADHIADFDPNFDRIALDRSIFTGLATGHLSAGALAVGTAAKDTDDRVIYDSATGTLYFDPDGTGAMPAQVFATVHDGLVLTADNFVAI